MNWAVWNNRKDIVELLISNGADVNDYDNVSTALINMFDTVLLFLQCNNGFLSEVVMN